MAMTARSLLESPRKVSYSFTLCSVGFWSKKGGWRQQVTPMPAVWTFCRLVHRNLFLKQTLAPQFLSIKTSRKRLLEI